MEGQEFPSDREVSELLRAPVELEQLPSGDWRARKLGHVGIGPTRETAAADLGRKIWKAVSRPKL
jgi:hypothetical protein